MGKKRANGEGSIRKRKDGRWEGFYTASYDPATGKQKIKNVLGKTQAEVKEKLKKAIADSQRLDMNRSGTHTVKSWVQMWYEVYAEPRLRENTKDYYLNYINNHIIPNWGTSSWTSSPRSRSRSSTTISRRTGGCSGTSTSS